MVMQYNIYKSGLYLGEASRSDGQGWVIRAARFFENASEDSRLPSPLDFDIGGVLEKICSINEHLPKQWEKTFEHLGVQYSYCAAAGMLYEQTDGLPVDLVVHNGRVIGCVAPRREHCAVICEKGMEKHTPLALWEKTPYNSCLIQKISCMVPMRDGTRLATDIYLPSGGENERRAAILLRTPYGRKRMTEEEWRFVRLGYALVVQDVRGRFESEGTWIPFHSETEDGFDTLEYLSSQAWCNGKIGMIGASYGAYTQMCAAASGHPALKAVISIVTAGGPFTDVPRRGGAFLSGFLAWGSAVAGKETQAELMNRNDWPQILAHRPIADVPSILVKNGIPFFDEWFAHETYDAFWQKDDWTLHSENLRVPALFLSGFFDDNVYGTTQGYGFARSNGSPHRLIMGAWGHNLNTRRRLHGFDLGNKALRYDIDFEFVRWFDQWLCDGTSVQADAAVEFYDFRAQAWRYAESLPLPGAEAAKYYLCDGQRLSTHLGESGHVQYRYNPAEPTPSLINPSENEMNMIGDYANVDHRADVVFFDSEPFQEAALLTGESKVTLYVASDCPDTDFIVRLSVLTQEGHSLKLAENVVRAKLRNGFTREEPLVPGEVVPITLPLQLIGVTIGRGESFRLSVCSAAENLLFVNGNTGNKIPAETGKAIANNRIFFGRQYPSAVEIYLGGCI